jgi:hypothetical protein
MNTMSNFYANNFSEIPAALGKNDRISRRMVALIASEPVAGKSIEEPERLACFREILRQLTLGKLNIHQAIRQVESRMPLSSSKHASNRRVFSNKWEERLVRTQYSRFYNQAVLEELRDTGVETCIVPVSRSQQEASKCSQEIAGRVHTVSELLRNLVAAYADNDFSHTKKIPEHPHCTHVVRPVLEE